MAKHVEAMFGQKTLAYLDKCMFCGKEYSDGIEWHTLYADGRSGIVWMVVCDGCYREMLESEEAGA